MECVDVPEKLQKLVEMRGLSQSELARRAGLPQPRVNQYINGKARLFADQAWKLARALEVSADVLLDPAVEVLPEVPDEREKQVREIVARKGWDWVYWRIIEAPAGEAVPGVSHVSPTYGEEQRDAGGGPKRQPDQGRGA